jgi:hypothetical protein
MKVLNSGGSPRRARNDNLAYHSVDHPYPASSNNDSLDGKGNYEVASGSTLKKDLVLPPCDTKSPHEKSSKNKPSSDGLMENSAYYPLSSH